MGTCGRAVVACNRFDQSGNSVLWRRGLDASHFERVIYIHVIIYPYFYGGPTRKFVLYCRSMCSKTLRLRNMYEK